MTFYVFCKNHFVTDKKCSGSWSHPQKNDETVTFFATTHLDRHLQFRELKVESRGATETQCIHVGTPHMVCDGFVVRAVGSKMLKNPCP